MDDMWSAVRAAEIDMIERYYELQGTSPQRLMSRGKHALSRKDNIIVGVWYTWKEEERIQGEYEKAIADGAVQMTLPPDVENTGRWRIPCCDSIDLDGMDFPQPDDVELTIFEWTVWTCPRCGEVYALRIAQPENINEPE